MGRDPNIANFKEFSVGLVTRHVVCEFMGGVWFQTLFCSSLEPCPVLSPMPSRRMECSRPFCPKLEMQQDQRGRGMLTLTGEEVTIRE
jgi:hypothetical protein